MFTDLSRRLLADAVKESDSLQHDYLGTGHILLAVLGERSGTHADILDFLRVDREAVRVAVYEAMSPGLVKEPPAERPYTQGARRVLEAAMASAKETGAAGVDGNQVVGAATR